MSEATLFHPQPLDGGSSEHLRGDRITGERYWSPEFMQKEWDRMWTRVWHIGARASQMPEAGDFVVHNFGRESVLIVRQPDGTFKAFFNVCQHRGTRLVLAEEGSIARFTCAYHGWQYALNGDLIEVQDPENFKGGSPCGRVRLKELPCDSWGGFIWYSMDVNAKPLREYLDPIPQLFKNRDLESMVRVLWRKMEVKTNWKFASDNFNESYHLPTVHPQMRQMIDESYRNTVFEMYPSGHNRIIVPGAPSMRADAPNEVEPIWREKLLEWGLDPADFAGRARDGRVALQKAKRERAAERGHHYIAQLEDDELTDNYHHTLFPNVTITASPFDGQIHVFRTEPHPSDPETSFFEYMALSPVIEGADEVMTVAGPVPLQEASLEILTFGVDEMGDFVDQDLSVAVWQQKGLRSRGYEDACLSEQESRVRRFHEVLNDYLEGRR